MGRLLLSILILSLITQLGYAEIPRTMSYQGLLTNASGNPVANGKYQLVLSIYDSESGVSPLWTETHTNVAVVNGIFNVILGDAGAPLSLPFDEEYWLGIAVGSGSELQPRIKLTSVAYSLNSANAESVSDGTVTKDKLANNAITSSKIASGQVVKTLNGLKDDVILAEGANITITKSGQKLTITSSGGGGGGVPPDNSVTTAKIVDGAVTEDKLAKDSVTSGKIVDNAVSVGKIQPDVLSSVDGVANDGGNVDLVPKNAITIAPNDTSNNITIGEDHSSKTNNPHSVTAAQAGALVSVDGVSNAGGNIDLVPGSNITIKPSDSANTITISATGGGGDDWSLTGNTGTIPGTDFLGTTDDKALQLHVNSARALRLEPDATSPNIIGGYSGNSITSGVHGATIGGGGEAGELNRVTDNYGTIGGGESNQAGNDSGTTSDGIYATVGGGYDNRATASKSTIGGGQSNQATGWFSIVGGGTDNEATGSASAVGGGGNNQATNDYSTVGGGYDNQATGVESTIGGGEANQAAGEYSTVPGGLYNEAQGDYSFAAGRKARISSVHDGAFLFADSSDFDFNSAAADEFAVRCTGGARFVAEIDGSGNPTVWTELDTTTGEWIPNPGSPSDRNLKTNFAPVAGREVLRLLASIPIETWNYKNQASSIRHIGPMAQDFHSAFGFGRGDKRIEYIDADGVALAAIQGLYEIVNEKVAENRELRQEVDDLKARIAALEKLVVEGK